ncbi:hypothetical protein GDO86_012211 [Hymenochirus boettgeri]|uniref:UPAR/Ly6 domain-containing protein n=1 Tax=Hymenochirus boettgeri TaxID=247094 RepID=A0A8T2ITM3_9PIPI|nr:hypothetical protein GDO86_012211 [Hymenochirus boettgeri]
MIISGLFIVLISFAGTGYSIHCQQCSSTTEKNCKGNETKCSSMFDLCISKYISTKDIKGQVIETYFSRGCGKLHDCLDPVIFTNDNITVEMSVECCWHSICVLKDFPSKNKHKGKEVKCKNCYSDNESTCNKNNNTMVCPGEEPKCASINYQSKGNAHI